MENRKSGLLLHITSLPSKFGIGDLGPSAYKFVDFLKEAGQHFWQILPLNPTDLYHDNSPYRSVSAFAFNTLLISPEFLVHDGLVDSDDININIDKNRIDYKKVTSWKQGVFEKAFSKFSLLKNETEFEEFCIKNQSWLEDFALFTALKEHFKGKSWIEWPDPLKNRNKEILSKMRNELGSGIMKVKFLQYIFYKQWNQLKKYCNDNGVEIIGDIPIYVTLDSSDVWTNSELFKLDENKNPIKVAGVPPDYFSKTGQLWSNPVYRWDIMKKNRYKWWIDRVRHNENIFDIFRIDHFRGFIAFWEVDAKEDTAKNGTWVKAPAKDFFRTLTAELPGLKIIAEDLGSITPDVVEIIDIFNFPGMRVIQFAFGKNFPKSEHLPDNVITNCLFYTGTHDNNTVKGWFKKETDKKQRRRVSEYAGQKVTKKNVADIMIKLVMDSKANICIIPVQDILSLDEKSRMNIPAINRGNWRWKLKEGQLENTIVAQLSKMVKIYRRK
ncbi:4-alpha-glucanotransferase [bacterium]|nr:4-alpha-glucanotransferase [bacterium]